ncbi:MAG: lytic transglycosylase domain-containing protein [Holophagales bacterium]|nr:lytic transglycosylase domain-containing protein [Holophagales bacterium]
MTATIRAADPTPGRGHASRRPGLRSAVLVLASGLWCLPGASARAEVVVFTDGGFLRVQSFERIARPDGDRFRLELPSGGTLVVSIQRVERILDDRISQAPPPEPVPVFPLRFDPAQSVPRGPYGELIHEVSRRHGLNPSLVAAVAAAESAFDPTAVSVKGAQGLMQLMPATAERFGLAPHEVFEPERNLDAGSRYLRWLADRFNDDLGLVLAAYNAGEGTVDRYDGIPPFRETRGYIRRIYDSLGLGDPPG